MCLACLIGSGTAAVPVCLLAEPLQTSSFLVWQSYLALSHGMYDMLMSVAALADYTGRFARKEDIIQAENGRDGNDSMSADSEGFLSSSDEDEPPTTGEADL